MKPINVGVIGAGEHMLRAHAVHLVRIPDVNITRYFDPRETPSDAFETFSTRGSERPVKCGIDDILGDEKIDAVFIGSPDEFHPEQFYLAVMAGKNVFVEKPLAIDNHGLGVVGNALGIAKEKGLVVSTCHPRRFDLPILDLIHLYKYGNSLIEPLSSTLGRVFGFDFRFLYHRVAGDWKVNRSLLLDHFGHEIDLLRFFFQEIYRETNFEESDYQLKFNLHTVFDSYAGYKVAGEVYPRIGQIEVEFNGLRIIEQSEYHEALVLNFEKGTAILNINTGLLIIIDKDGSREVQLRSKDYEKMFCPVNMNFISAIREEGSVYITPEDILFNTKSGIELSEYGFFCDNNSH